MRFSSQSAWMLNYFGYPVRSNIRPLLINWLKPLEPVVLNLFGITDPFKNPLIAIDLEKINKVTHSQFCSQYKSVDPKEFSQLQLFEGHFHTFYHINRLSTFLIQFRICLFLIKVFIYLFRERGREGERERETSICGCLSHAPYWGTGLQPRHVP